MTGVDSLPKKKLGELDWKVGIGYFNKTTDFSVAGSGSASMYRVHVWPNPAVDAGDMR